MQQVERNMEAHPGGTQSRKELTALSKSILVSTTCLTCADACIAQDNPKEMAECARICLDCASVCEAASQLLARPDSSNHSFLYRMLETVQDVCDSCADECEKFPDKEFAAVCAKACRSCIGACQDLIQ